MKSLCLLSLALALQLQGPPPRTPHPNGPPHQQGQSDKPKPRPGQRGTDSLPLVVKLSPAQVDQIVAAQKSDKGQQEPASNWWMVGLTGGLLFVALGQAGLFVWQLGLIRKANEAATNAANAAREGVVLARETAQQELRAYLTRSGDVHVRELPQPRGKVILEFQFKVVNAGATPAYDVVTVYRTAIFPSPLTEVLGEPSDSLPGASRGEVGPGRAFAMLIQTAPLEPQQVSQFRGGGSPLAIFLQGRITYRDAFGRNQYLKFLSEIIWRDGKPFAATGASYNDAS